MTRLARFFILFALALLCSFTVRAETKLKINFPGANLPFAEPELLMIRGGREHSITIVTVRHAPLQIRELRMFVNGSAVPTKFNSNVGVATGTVRDNRLNWDAKKSNIITAEATLAGGQRIRSNELIAVGMPFPQWLGGLLSIGSARSDTVTTWRLSLTSEEFTRDLRWIGEFGFTFSLNGEFALETNRFEYSTEISGGAEISHGSSATSIGIGGSGEGGVVQDAPEGPFRFTADKWTVFLELSKEFELIKKTIADALKPGMTQTINQIPFIGRRLNNIISKFSIRVTAEPGIRGSLVVKPDERPQIVSGLINGEMDVRVTAKARLRTPGFGKVGLTAFVGGKPSFEVQTVSPVFRQLAFQVSAGVGFHFGPWYTEFNHVLINVNTGPVRNHPSVESVLSDNDENHWELFANPGRTRYPILGANQTPKQRIAMRRFVTLTNRLSTARPDSANIRRSSAVVTLATNSSPLSHPAMAAHEDELIVVLAEDSRPEGEETSPCQFTRLVSTRFDGANWSAPRRVTLPGSRKDGAQIAPSVRYDGRGRAVAVWQQVDDPELNTGDPGRYLQHNDVRAAIYQPARDTWGVPFNFGVPDRGDLAPSIRGPLFNGDLIVLWQRARVPSFYAKSAPNTNTEIRMVRWNSRQARWVNTQAVTNLSENVVTYDFDARGRLGVLVMNVDRGGRGRNSDYELEVMEYDASTLNWRRRKTLTRDNAYDTNPSVLVSPEGETFIAWTRNGNLVVDRDLQNKPEIIQRDSEGTEISEVRLQNLTEGRISVTWSEYTLGGSTVFTKIYDPRTRTWGTNSLCPGLPMETVYDTATDPAGNLVTLFTETKIDLQTVQAPDDHNEPVVVEEMPIPDKESIKIAKYRPNSHLVITELTTDAASIRPGQTITLRATVADRGLMGVRLVEVNFYEGNPRNGGRLLGTETARDLPGGESVVVSHSYRVPSPIGRRPIYAQIKTVRAKVLYLNGIYLTATVLGSEILRGGQGTVDLLLANDGVPAAGRFVVDMLTPIGRASVEVPGVPAGGTRRVTLRLRTGSIPRNGNEYTIRVDPGRRLPGVIAREGDTVFLKRGN